MEKEQKPLAEGRTIRLVTSKRHRLANIILALSAFIYMLVYIGQFYVNGAWYEALYWMSQSALVGSLADWFAVTALFRKPLGFPYHTDLIARNRGRMVDMVVSLAESRLLSVERCRILIEGIAFDRLIHTYINSSLGRASLGRLLQTLLHTVWQSRTSRDWAQAGGQGLRSFLQKQAIVPVLRQVVMAICQDNRYERFCILVLKSLQEGLQSPRLRNWIQALIDQEIERKKTSFLSALLINVSQAADIINSRDMADTLLKELDALMTRWQQTNSQERQAWLKAWAEPLSALMETDAFIGTVEGVWQAWVKEEAWGDLLEKVVFPHLSRLVVPEEGVSPLAEVTSRALQDVWNAIYADETARTNLNKTIQTALVEVLTKSHIFVGLVIRQVLEGLSTERFIRFIQEKVDDDLSWIRINGAIVGSLCGFFLWAFLTCVYNPLLVFWGL